MIEDNVFIEVDAFDNVWVRNAHNPAILLCLMPEIVILCLKEVEEVVVFHIQCVIKLHL
eukprot:m.51677 g.51677  ORF g.51677 m.51677 type:complete len:59 (-) comp10958_c0_seq2:37-213(-)